MLIFLDIDGVMIPAQSWRVPEDMGDGMAAFSPKATEALCEILSGYTENAVRVMLTTSHRDRFTIDQWKSIFKNRGINIKSIERLPSNSSFEKKRLEEILEWFKFNPMPDNFMIIDDDKSLNLLPAHLKSHLIQTSSSVGLSADDLSIVA